MDRMGMPSWYAWTRRAENERPSRSRWTPKVMGLLASPGRRKYPCMECTPRPSGTVRLPAISDWRQHLAAEDAVPGLLLRGAHEDVLVRPGTLQLTEVQQLEERGGGVLRGRPLQSGFGFSHGSTLDVPPAPPQRGTAGRVDIVSDVLTQPLQFTDPRDLADLRTFATRAKSIDDGAIRLQASGPVLAAYVCVLRPRLLGEVDADHPRAADHGPGAAGGHGRHRPDLRGAGPAGPRGGERRRAAAAARDRHRILGRRRCAPRSGWEAVGTLQDSALRQSAEAGITEIAAIIPDKPGALIVNNARATVWGRELPGAGGLPLGAAFAALTLGFLADGEQQLYRAGRWFRLSGARGHVLARTGSGLNLRL